MQHKEIIEESKRYRIQKSKFRLRFLVLYCLLLTAYCLLTSCGRKGEPTLKSYEKPDPPSELRAIHRDSEIILMWKFPKNKESSIKGFYLMKIIPPSPPLEKGGRGDYEKIAFLENDKRSYIDTNFNIGFLYKYKIVSQNLRDITSNDSNIIEVEPKKPPPPPVTLSFKIMYDSLLLTWKSAGEGILYNVYKNDKKGLYPLMPVNEKPIKETNFKDTLNVTKPVYYTIRSLLGTDIWDEGPASEEIVIDPMEFVPSPPEGLHSVVTRDSVYLTWKEVPEIWVIGYRVYRKINKQDRFILIGETQIPVFLDREKPKTKRSYRITAVGPSKESPPIEISDVVFVPQR